MNLRYEVLLHCFGPEPLHLRAGDDGGIVNTQLLRQRARETQDRLLSIADTADKLRSAGWDVVEPTSIIHGEDYVLLCHRGDNDSFATEDLLRGHLMAIGVPIGADYIEMIDVEDVDDENDDGQDEADDNDLDDLDDLDDDFAPERRLYLVRWQNLSAALVMACDENELLAILDEEADTTACSWWEYDGPLFLDFTLPIEWKHADKQADEENPSPLEPERWVPENICITKMPDDVLEIQNFEMYLAGSDTMCEAEEKIFKLAFPRLYEVSYGRSDDHDPEGRPPEDQVAAAVRDEIARTMREHRRIQRDTEQRAADGDHRAAIALLMGTSIEQTQNMDANSEPPELPAEQPLPPLVPPPGETGN